MTGFGHLEELPRALSELATGEALTTFYVATVAATQEWNDQALALLEVARQTSGQIVAERSKRKSNPLAALARAVESESSYQRSEP